MKIELNSVFVLSVGAQTVLLDEGTRRVESLRLLAAQIYAFIALFNHSCIFDLLSFPIGRWIRHPQLLCQFPLYA